VNVATTLMVSMVSRVFSGSTQTLAETRDFGAILRKLE